MTQTLRIVAPDLSKMHATQADALRAMVERLNANLADNSISWPEACQCFRKALRKVRAA